MFYLHISYTAFSWFSHFWYYSLTPHYEDWAHTHSSPLTLFHFPSVIFLLNQHSVVYPIMTRQIRSQLSQVVYSETSCFLLCLCCFVCFVNFVLCILSLILIQTFWANFRTVLSYKHASFSCSFPPEVSLLGEPFCFTWFCFSLVMLLLGPAGEVSSWDWPSHSSSYWLSYSMYLVLFHPLFTVSFQWIKSSSSFLRKST